MKEGPVYWINPLENKFQVTIVACNRNEEIYEIGIKENVIRPSSGGQAGDRGKLRVDETTLDIQDTILIDGVVALIAEKPVEPNTTAALEIDMNWRRSSMRNHTAEHIFMSAMKRIQPDVELGYIWIDGNHGTVDIMGSRIGVKEILDGEELVHDVIMSNLPVRSELVQAGELPATVRAREGVTDKHELMRIVSVGEFDKSACSGIHVLTTGDIGIFKVCDLKSVEGGIRVEFVTGEIAVTKLSNVFNQVMERKHEYPYEMEQIGAVLDKAKVASLERMELIEKIADLVVGTHGSRLASNVTFVHHYLPGFDAKQMKPLVKKLKPAEPYAILLFAPSDKPTLIFATGNMPEEASKYVAGIVEKLGGRGGGSRSVYTGGFSEVDDSRDLYGKLVDSLMKRLA